MKTSRDLDDGARGADPHILRRARELFIGSGELITGVRDIIADSWQRSSSSGVQPDRLPPGGSTDDATDPKLLTCVDTVLGTAIEQFSGESLSIVFAAPDGHVLRRYCTDGSFGRRLERVHLAPGVSYGEGMVGTNGIGTALELARPTLVVGDEHFNENLAVFGCAGAPVRHPITHTLLGLVDLTTFADVANPLLLGLASTLAGRVEQELQQMVGSREMALLRDYQAACRQSNGPVLALNPELVMVNTVAERWLDGDDRMALLSHTSDVTHRERPGTFLADLPSGTVAKLDYRPTFLGAELAGGVFRVQLVRPPEIEQGRSVRLELPELSGTSPDWLRAVNSVRSACRAGEWVILEGEQGVGKTALSRAVHDSERPREHLRQVDAFAAATDPEGWLAVVEDELASPGTLLITHVDALPTDLIEALGSLLDGQGDSAQQQGKWVVLTRVVPNGSEAVDAALVPIFDRTLTVAPLRHRMEDIEALVPVILRRVGKGNDLEFTRRAMNLLKRNAWPGNVIELQKVLRKVVQRRRTGTIDLVDLPSECLAVGRRTLSPLEALERDAIVQALTDFDGNKNLAAEHVGMSRATIYRKIRDYHIVWE